MPISIVDNRYFQRFVYELDPKYSLPCRQTVSYTVLSRIRETKQEKVQTFLDTCKHVALTTDIWTDQRAHAFLGVTVHAYQNGLSRSYLLAFRAFHGTHTGRRIADVLDSVISDFRIQQKVRYVVTDNASNMKKAITILFDNGKEHRLDDDADSSLW